MSTSESVRQLELAGIVGVGRTSNGSDSISDLNVRHILLKERDEVKEAVS